MYYKVYGLKEYLNFYNSYVLHKIIRNVEDIIAILSNSIVEIDSFDDHIHALTKLGFKDFEKFMKIVFLVIKNFLFNYQNLFS